MAGPGEAAWEVGCQRAAREEGSFSYRNATIIEHDGQCGGCLIGYEIPDNAGPIPEDMPAMFVPMQELENLAPATWYINVLAVLPQFRGQGLGTKLMALANKTAEALGKRGISVIVSDANAGARRLYERCGYSREADGQRSVEERGTELGSANESPLSNGDEVNTRARARPQSYCCFSMAYRTDLCMRILVSSQLLYLFGA
jgi:GNAT superfamily N-acetyltransferase